VTHLYLIRHAEAVSNVEPIIAGMRSDTGLTAHGVAQAERLRDRLAAGEIAADVLIASTLLRARQTAEIIAPALGLPIVWDDEVQEMRPGAADGMRGDEMVAMYGDPDAELDPLRPIAPGGESWAQFMLRVAGALQRITNEHSGQTIAIVCHGGVIDGSFHLCFGLSLLSVAKVRFATHNTSITHWERLTDESRSWRWRLERYNDASHLDATLPQAGPSQPSGPDEHPSVPLPSEE
jgi:2,3-bisphosphoglycerate-dependent phosphoglycerate mutase